MSGITAVIGVVLLLGHFVIINETILNLNLKTALGNYVKSATTDMCRMSILFPKVKTNKQKDCLETSSMKQRVGSLCLCVFVFQFSKPREIFSPESAGRRKTSRAKVEIRTHGMRRLRP